MIYLDSDQRVIDTLKRNPTIITTGEDVCAAAINVIERLKQREAELSAYVERLRNQLERVVGMHNPPNDCYTTGPFYGDLRDLSCPSCEALALLEETPPQSLHDRDMRIAEAVREAIYRRYKGRAEGESVGWIINNTNLHTILGWLHRAP